VKATDAGGAARVMPLRSNRGPDTNGLLEFQEAKDSGENKEHLSPY